MRPLTLLLAASLSCWAGQGLPRTSAETASNSSVAAQPVNGPCRLEVMIYVVDASPEANKHSLTDSACGIDWQWVPVSPTDIRLQLYGQNLTGGAYGACQILGLEDYLIAGFYVRFQIIPDGAGGTTLCQAWDINGTRFSSSSQTYTGTTGSHSNGLSITSAGTGKAMSWGFVKLYTTNVSETARMPVNGENGDLLSWLFNGSGADTSGNSYTASFSGAASYTTQPGQDLIKAVAKTVPAPTWTDRRTLRVGVLNALDASGSFSQTDGSSTVTCDWALTSSQPGGLLLPFDDATNNCAPNATPNGFGDYLVTLSLTNIDMVTATPQIHIGAAKMTATGVITPDDPNVTKIFGPMIALGWTPWAWMDERWSFAQTARRAVYQTPPAYLPSYTQVSNPVWANLLAGTVDWTWNGTGFGGGGTGTTLNGGISDTATTIVLNSTTGLDLSSLPGERTKISIIGSGTSEEIDICGVSSLTLTVCYDGRGKVGPFGRQATVLGPTTWSNGATVGQALLKGTGTDFMGAEKIAEAGAGPIGPVTYSTGTITATAGSNAITGSGTSWLTDSGNLGTGSAIGVYSTTVIGASWTTGTATVIVNTPLWSVGAKISVQGVSPSGYNVVDATVTAISGQYISYAVVSDPGMFSGNGTAYASNGWAIRIQATHSTTPFVFYAYISSASSNTGLAMNRVFPADADTASGLTYQIIRPFFRYPVMQFTAEEGAEDNDEATAGWAGSTCVSDTQCFLNPQIGGADVVGYNGTPQSGAYTFYDADSSLINQGGGGDFYGEELAWYAGHFRSGLYEPLDTARMMANTYIKYPGLRGGLGGNNPYSPLLVGGGINGAFACLTLDSGCGLEWKNARGFVYQGNYWATNVGGSITCNTQDSRDGGYLGSWLAMGANFDPLEATYNWSGSFPTWYAFENGCKGSDNSFANNFLINLTQYPAATFTNGSTAGTGSSFTAAMCFGRAQGNFTIDAMTGIVTATGGSMFDSASDERTLVLNVSGGHRLAVQVEYTDSTHMTIRAEWPSGWATTGTWMQLVGETTDLIGMTAWGQDTTSTSYESNYECIYNNSTSLTLERPWEYANGAYIPTVSTRLGISIAGHGAQPYMAAFRAFAFNLAANKDTEQGTDFGTFKTEISTWAANTGYDPVVRGLLAGAVFQSCTPAVVPTGSGGTSFTQPGCSYSLIPAAQIAGRELNAEGGRSFLYNTTNNLVRGDDQYEALWCSTQYNDSTYYASIPACDAVSPGDNIGLSNMSDAYFAGNKWPGFFFGMGMAHQWPAFRLGEDPGGTGGSTISGAVTFSGAVTIH